MIIKWGKIAVNVIGSAVAAGAPVFFTTGSWQLAVGAAIAAVAGNQLGLHQTPPVTRPAAPLPPAI